MRIVAVLLEFFNFGDIESEYVDVFIADAIFNFHIGNFVDRSVFQSLVEGDVSYALSRQS